MSKLVIIDGHAIMYRAFHAMPPLTTPGGEPINAVHGTISMLLNILQMLKPTHIAFAFDEKAPTFRNKALPSYQAQRPPMPGELSSQFDKVKKFLEKAGIPYYSKPGYEADDVIGTIATQCSEITNDKYQMSNETIIVTGDRDQLQLVDDKKGIKLYMPIAGLMNAKLFGEVETVERMGVLPNQIPDLKALIGDPSDNYKGVAGIGPKTATDLLSKFKSMSKIYENLDKVTARVREKLEKGKESCDQSYMLATIVKDVPVNFELAQMARWDLGSHEVVKLFEKEFGFKTLTVRIKKFEEDLEKEKQGSLFN